MRSALPTLALLALLAVPALARDAPAPPEIDLREVTPESLGGEDPAKHLAEANRLYEAGDHEGAARAFVRALRARPGDSAALYNLACCYGLLGMEDQAAAFLRASWEAGFRDLNHIRHDRDFRAVRDSEVFGKLLTELGREVMERGRREGKRHFVRASVMWDFRVVEPQEIEPRTRYPLVVGLHGYGATPESFAGLFAGRGIDQPFYFCALRAPYPESFGTRIGYSWVPVVGQEVSHRVREEGRALSEQLVLAAIEEMKREYPVDSRRVFLMGFSQGGGMTFGIGLCHPEIFAGIVPVGGWCDDGTLTPAQVASAAEHARVLVCHSPEDARVPYSGIERAMAFLREAGIPFRLVRYAGGHSVPTELCAAIVEWIADPVTGGETTLDAAEEED